MKTQLLSALTGLALFTGVGIANAGEPMALSAAQMDQVTAGAATATALAAAVANAFGPHNASADTATAVYTNVVSYPGFNLAQSGSISYSKSYAN